MKGISRWTKQKKIIQDRLRWIGGGLNRDWIEDKREAVKHGEFFAPYVQVSTKEVYLNKIMSKSLALTAPPPPYVFVGWQNKFCTAHIAIISQHSLPQAHNDHTVNDSRDCQVTTAINSAPFDSVPSPWERQMTSPCPPAPMRMTSTAVRRFFVEVFIGEF
jgi:hypothetical protein